MITAAWLACVIACAWVMLGYPAWTLWRVKRLHHERDERVEAPPPAICVLVIVRDGGEWVMPKLQSICAQEYPRDRVRIIVVSDGSIDETDASVASVAKEDERVQLMKLSARGKASSIAEALPLLSEELIVLTDIRQPLAPGCLSALVHRFADPRIGVVSGELQLGHHSAGERDEAGLYWRIESRIRRALGRIDSTLGATGPLYAIRRSLLRAPPPGTILDDVYIPIQAFLAGYRLVVEPKAVAWERPISRQQEFRRKVRTAAGMYQLLRLEPRLMSPRTNRLFADFLSYKLGRLILPHLVLSEMLLALILPTPLRPAVVGAHLVVLTVLAIGSVASDNSPWRRAAAPIAATFSMLAAAFLGQRALFGRTDGIWVPTRPASTAPRKT
jgi:cellulose synthase/poly-beta-1,6-N-acetylglucosamine synthase-like glycosyltransferase